ncbi:MAG: valine--tRNA ligase [Actinobacteria bacterium 13_1_20CM_2_65_11]|nr:MAG: valine--tRNA ligase [Actinobacteria bacterium 13_1_40CM_4_65_12]OLE78736.1 MAG: valine--tRNA ligase [Actinobacteria bacterium 13_1_20CM_2_65_11]
MTEMPKSYDHKATEAGWYARWDEAGLFTANARSPKPKYTICLPPPNITGELHMGHALNHSLQDFCSRYRRMSGYEVLFLPGMDHAAIATQNVIEKQLAAEGMTKEQLGREAFESRVNEWYVEVGDTIVRQDRILGASLDWTRLRFTMDERYVRSVMTAFVAFYERGWIYRAPRIVNWCPHDQSAISDLEVKWEEHHDTLYYIRYPIEGGGEVVIATVRPETMLADTAVAVNPTDPRYRSIVGKTAILPLVGRKLPIVADEAVEKDFGTGALKVTPGHDQMDYEIGQRHHLEIVNGMHPDGRMNVPGLPYDGRPALEARQLVVRDLKSQGYVVKEEPYTHEVGHCDRCDAIIEPLISEQWWLRMDKMRDKALGASAEGKVRWHPERYERTYLDWLHGLRDWNIGRQLWLGHRVPVYNCENGHRTVAVERPAECTECGSRQLTQDPDVLDTWFSSALWPFATLGWPDETEDLRAFYPNDMNSTAREIINLWVSRMIMTGLEFMGEVPFSDVAIHCQVQAADGRRMSKSLGTGLDPRRLITKYGADAVRAWAASVAMSSQDVRFDESRVEGYRRFCNKLWNAERLVLGNIGDGAVPAIPEADELELIEDRWILSRLASAQREVTDGIEGFEFQDSINAAYGCTWNELCDWWLEAAKDRLKDGDKTAQAVAIFCLDNLLRLLHPFMPFVTEDLWSRLPGERDFIMRAQWPEDLHRYVDGQAEVEFERLMDTVNEIRSYRKTIAGAPAKGGAVKLFEPAPPDWVRALTLLGSVAAVDELPPGKSFGLSAGSIVFPAIAAADPMIAAKKKAELQKELDRVQAKLDNPEFRAKAPESVIAEQQSRADELRAAIDRLE